MNLMPQLSGFCNQALWTDRRFAPVSHRFAESAEADDPAMTMALNKALSGQAARAPRPALTSINFEAHWKKCEGRNVRQKVRWD